MISCECCKKTFSRMQSLERHNTSKLHEIRSSSNNVKKYTCDCGKYYLHQQSLRNHKMKCSYAGAVVAAAPSVVETQIEAMQKKLDIYEKERIDQKQIVESMQQKFDVQQKNIKSMQQKIDLITILLQNGAGREATTSTHDSTCLITEPQPQKSRDKRKKISKDMRQHIVNKQENACGICKLVLTPYFEMDHIIGLQFGGTDDEANLMALCRDCHAKKSITENQRRDKIKDAIQTILSE